MFPLKIALEIQVYAFVKRYSSLSLSYSSFAQARVFLRLVFEREGKYYNRPPSYLSPSFFLNLFPTYRGNNSAWRDAGR